MYHRFIALGLSDATTWMMNKAPFKILVYDLEPEWVDRLSCHRLGSCRRWPVGVTRRAQQLIESLCRSLQPPKTRDKSFVGRADFIASAS